MSYKRLTKWSDVGTLHIFDFCGQEVPLSEATALNHDCIAGGLAFLEDKIESGDLVDRNEYLDRLMTLKNVSTMTDKEIEFFAKHNAEVRNQTINDCLESLRDISSPGIVESLWVGWSEAINAAIKEIVKRTCKVE